MKPAKTHTSRQAALQRCRDIIATLTEEELFVAGERVVSTPRERSC